MPQESDAARAPRVPGPELALRDAEGLVGRTVGGKYKVLSVLARGGMGRIYTAEQLPLGRPVALKVLHSELDETGSDPGFQKRFLLEAASCAQLRHPNIVVVYDYGKLEESEREAYFMAMELIEGRTLGQLIRDEGTLATVRALRIAREIARALREAHRQGMVHRDLKPSNVMVVEGGEGEQIKVLDFGLVKVMRDDSEELTKEGHFLGSPKYMAPEQIKRHPVDGRADLYALGVLLYQMLCGRVPFEGEQAVQTLMAQISDPVPPMDERPDLPPSVQAIVMHCLEKDPELRYPSAEALIRAIDDVASSIAGWSGVHVATTSSGEGPTVSSSSSSYSLKGALAPVLSGPGLAPTLPAPPLATTLPAPGPARGSWPKVVAMIALAALIGGGLAVFGGGSGSGSGVEVATEPRSIVPPEPEAQVPSVAEPERPSSPQVPVQGAELVRFTLFVASEPPGGILRRGEVVIGTTPTFVDLDRAELASAPATFRVELAGHAPYVWTQGPSSTDVHVTAPLEALDRPRTAVRRRPPRPPVETAPPSGADVAIKTRR